MFLLTSLAYTKILNIVSMNPILLCTFSFAGGESIYQICANHLPSGNESGRIDTIKPSQVSLHVLSVDQNITGSLNFTRRPKHPIFR